MIKELKVPISNNLWQMMQHIPENQRFNIGQMVERMILSYREAKKKYDGISVAAAFHKLIDKEMNSEETKQNPYFKRIACKKGCGFCCYVNVDINEDEADLIIEYCKEQEIEIDIERLKKQFDKTDKNYSSELTVAERKCNFLSSDMTCKIYEHRPSACRKFNALDTNKICEDDKNVTHPLFSNLNLEIIQIGIYQGSRTDNMPKLLLEKLNQLSQ